MRIYDEPRATPLFRLSRVALAAFEAADDHIDGPEKATFSGAESELCTFNAQAVGELSFRPDDLPVHVRRLFDAGQAVWNPLVNHPFPGQMASGTASLNGFRHYMIQDAKYLEYYARVRMQSIAKSGSNASFKEIVAFANKLSRTLGYSTELRNICIRQLGVPEEVVDREPMSTQLHNSIQLYEGVVRHRLGDWLAMHIVLLPCIMGYYAIASRLLAQQTVVTNTPYYPLWIQTNASASSFRRYINFIHNSIQARGEAQRHWAYWNELFQSACRTETDFLNLGTTNRVYPVIPHAAYAIRNYGTRRYLASIGDQVIMLENPGASGRWTLSPSGSGYTIRSVVSQGSLTATIRIGFPEYCDITLMTRLPVPAGDSECQGAPVPNIENPEWSINPISAPQNTGHQLFWSPRMQYVLSADISGRESRVIGASNYQGTDQIWIIERSIFPPEGIPEVASDQAQNAE